jgi:hypothetical protein
MSRNARTAKELVERRAAARRPTALLAFAQQRGGPRFACQVKNISDNGAMLEFLGPHAVLLENAFDLVLANADVRYSVTLIWRKERTAGVEFCLEAD